MIIHWGFLILIVVLAFIAGFASCYVVIYFKEDVVDKLVKEITKDITSPPWHG